MEFVQSIFFILIWTLIVEVTTQLKESCSPLILPRNVEASCHKNGIKQNDCDTSRLQQTGTTIKYKCKSYFTPFENSYRTSAVDNVLKCDSEGIWHGLQRFEGFRCREDCGRIVGNAKPVIIHGVESNRSQFPWHANIFRNSRNTWTYICGGSIIRNQIVISAAHCFAQDLLNLRHPDEFRVILGSVSSTYSQNLFEDGIQVHKIQSIHISENFNPSQGFQSDIAIIRLKDNIEFNENILPVCLPSDYKSDVNALKTGSTAQVSGFGITETGKVSKTLRSLTLKVNSHAECHSALGRVLTESQFCGGSRNGTSWNTLCNGDSGGGLVVSSLIHEKFYIHGIVSSGDPDTEVGGVCKNFVIFTRIYPYIFWIRDVIEGITGEIARDLLQNPAYSYALRGTETNFAEFGALPREWYQRLTSLELDHVRLGFETLLTALQSSKTIDSISLTNVDILNWATTTQAQPIILPLLSSFTLDILNETKEFEAMQVDRTFPTVISTSFLRSLLFFDKNFENVDNWSPELLLTMNVDIELVVNIFRVLRIRTRIGELTVQQTKLVDNILERYSKNLDFTLRRLALHKCELGLQKISRIDTLAELILDRVSTDVRHFSSVFKNLPELTTLVWNPNKVDSQFELNLSDLPSEMIHLSLSYVRVLNSGQKLFDKLQTFCCFTCEFSIQSTSVIFPNAESIYIESEDQLQGSDVFLKSFSAQTPTQGKAIVLKRKSGTWHSIIPSDNERKNYFYSCTKQSYFWTSEEEFQALRRLKSFEKTAWRTQTYNFVGGKTPYGFDEFKPIPAKVQSKLKVINLTTVEISPQTLAATTKHCPDLESFTMLHILGRHDRSVQLSRRPWSFANTQQSDPRDITNSKYEKVRNHKIEFRLHNLNTSQGIFRYVSEFVDNRLEAVILPFQNPEKLKRTNVLHEVFVKINSIRLTPNDSTIYVLDTSLAELRQFQTLVLNIISHLPKTHVLQRVSPTLKAGYDLLHNYVLPLKWMFSGLHVIDYKFLQTFFKDDFLQVMSRTGILDFLLTHLGDFVTVERSTSLSLLKKEKNPYHFPLVHAVVVALNEDKIE